VTRRLIPKIYKRTRTIYVIGDVAFVPDPEDRSAWWKTHASVAVAACPTCKAPVGDRCVPSFGFCLGSTHATRKKLLPRDRRPTKIVTLREAAS